MGGGHARKSETPGVASGGSGTERAHVVTKKEAAVPSRIFIGGGLVDSVRETEKERGREDLVRDWKGDREQEAEVRERE